MPGRIHSLESFGTVDGPGIRFVVFMQGCPLRCLYCHNPDTWDINGESSIEMTPTQLLEEVSKYKNYIAKGGITVTGGEPLLQAAFLKEFFLLCREAGFHTALDTSGCMLTPTVKELLALTDLVLLDIKAIRPDMYRRLTGSSLQPTLDFLDYLEKEGIPVWIRHVIVPGWTANENVLRELAEYLSSYRMIEKTELLPYHTMGTYKYDQLNLNYPLKDTPELSTGELEKAKAIFREYGLPL